MNARLGRVTQVSPLRVLLKAETQATPAEPYAGMTPTLNQEVLVELDTGRRLILWAAP